jgi:Mrp family chromosome partitioning ATPase
VLLIDADLRRPSVGSQLGLIDEGPGLAKVVSDGDARLPDSVRTVEGVHGLSVLPGAPVSGDVHEVLRSPRFDQLLQDAAASTTSSCSTRRRSCRCATRP